MNTYQSEFLVFAIAHVISLISPGPDFLMVVRSSLRYSRKTALLVALGISVGELIHVTYSVLGLGIIIANSIYAFTVLKYVGGAYLVFIGIQSLRAKKETQIPRVGDETGSGTRELTPIQAFRSGFLTNALNAKAAFFTLSFFTVLVSPETPLWVQAGYGLFIQVSTFAWFAMVAYFLTTESLQSKMLGAKHWIERTAGAVLVALGLKLAFGQVADIASDQIV